MGTNYIPGPEADFLSWVDNFSAYVTSNFASLGLASSDASALAALTSSYDSAYAAAKAGSTRGPMTVNIKDTARSNVTIRARQLAIIMQANPAISDAQKTALGITLRKTNLTPIPPPTTSPLLTFIAATPLQHTLRWADQLTPALRAMPFGVVALRLKVWVYNANVTPPPDPGPPAPPTMVLQLTKQPGAIDFASGQVGLTAFYEANWMTRKGELGPNSNDISQIII